MNLRERPIASAKLIGGRLCLDFTNTVGGRLAKSPSSRRRIDSYEVREDRLTDYYDLLAWSLRVGLLTEAEARRLAREASKREAEAAGVWERAIDLREAVYRIALAVVSQVQPRVYDLEVLNHELSLAHDRLNLGAGEAGAFVWKWKETKDALDQMLWRIADSTAEMLTSGDLTRLRQCAGDNCGWLFQDISRNRSRQWCDMQDCGNVAKVRRFRSRNSRKQMK